MNNWKSYLTGVWIIIIMMFLFDPVFAFRCGNSLILEGDNVSKVIRMCGEPSATDGNSILTSADSLTYPDDGGMMCDLRVVNGLVVSIDCNRG